MSYKVYLLTHVPISAIQGWDRSSFADGLFSGSYLRICLSISITVLPRSVKSTTVFTGSKESGGNNSISGPSTIELNCSPFDWKYRLAWSHWESNRSGKGPSGLIIISIWLSSPSSGITGNSGIPVSNSNTKHPKLQMSMLAQFTCESVKVLFFRRTVLLRFERSYGGFQV